MARGALSHYEIKGQRAERLLKSETPLAYPRKGRFPAYASPACTKPILDLAKARTKHHLLLRHAHLPALVYPEHGLVSIRLGTIHPKIIHRGQKHSWNIVPHILRKNQALASSLVDWPVAT
jgi:hypothetical protein